MRLLQLISRPFSVLTPGLTSGLTARLTATAVTLTVAGAGVVAGGAAAPAAARTDVSLPKATKVADTSFEVGDDFGLGRRNGASVVGDTVRLTDPRRVRRIAGQRYDAATWTSPWVDESFAFTELIPSWQARTPGRSLVEVRVRLRTKGADGRTVRGTWDTVARWARVTKHFARTSLDAQTDDLARVAVDTVRTNAATGATGWQVRVVLLRPEGKTAKPRLERVGAMASHVVARSRTSKPGKAAGTVIDVPRYSQMVHRGHHPEWGNGGEAWCSPTSTAMVLEHYGANPRKGHRFKPGHADAIVDWTASMTYDHGYRGTGNWAFNTAYAGLRVPHARVTRLPQLRAAEKYVRAGTPLIVSVAFDRGELRGAPISATAGHLMVLVGFTESGDVVVNDPAAPDNASVRRTYDRAQFEKAWLTKSGGLTYVLED
ncbi:peptidase C39 family protein [Nocardioides sp. Y6]|uniref:Peptidase C39 family protein n=1 Tax=Nocardioides malaquae TaxID=2773426 RepID=A0ABR9RT06_9ACTN|nr:peptidase C39 family protein [Nocardioides malaquae]MBE7324696.1 peptidase C39 family protein [Nocardioides malaquae]